MRPVAVLPTILLALLAAGGARCSEQNPSPTEAARSQRPAGAPGIATASPDRITSEMIQSMIQTMEATSRRPQTAELSTRGSGGPLQAVSRLLAALDDPQARKTLDLTDEQADSLRKIIIDTEISLIQTAAHIAVNSIELRELLRADKPDKQSVMSKGDEISKSTSELISRYLNAVLAAKALLSPEQQEAIRSYLGNVAFPAGPARP